MAILYKIIVICFVFLMTSPTQGLAAPPAAVQAAAEKGISQFLSNIPSSELANMGLTSAGDIKAATLGVPHEQFTITPSALESYQPGLNISSLLTATNNWVYPVMVNGEARTQLNVVKSKGAWTAGYFGGTLPARINEGISSLIHIFQDQPSYGIFSANMAAVKLIRIPQVNADFLLIGNNVDEYLLPIDRGRSMVPFGADRLHSPVDVIPSLSIKVAESIRHWNESQRQ